MAFVRWRGASAPRLATVWEAGRPRQVLLAHRHGECPAAGALREALDAQYPALRIDGAAVDRALAAGPPERPALTPTARTWAETAHDLRTWALTTDLPGDRGALESAASVLSRWAARPVRPAP